MCNKAISKDISTLQMIRYITRGVFRGLAPAPLGGENVHLKYRPDPGTPFHIVKYANAQLVLFNMRL